MLNLDFANANDIVAELESRTVRFNTPDTVGRCHLEHAPRWARSEHSERPVGKLMATGLGD